MSSFIQIPPDRLDSATCQSLLEEYASRDGTDYGDRELSLEEKVTALSLQLERGDLMILFDFEAQTWDLLQADQARVLLQD